MEITEELGANYLVLEDKVKDEDQYLLRMLTENYIKNLLSCRQGYRNEEPVLKYDVSNMHSLVTEYEHSILSATELENMLLELLSIGARAREYLLDEKNIVYNPEYMFVDVEDDSLNLLYVPYETDEMIALHHMNKGRYYFLADFLLDKVDPNDEKAVKIAYEFYRMSKEELFSLDKFCTYIKRLRTESREKKATEVDSLRIKSLEEKEGELYALQKDNDIQSGRESKKAFSIRSLWKKRKERKEDDIKMPDGIVTVDDYWGASDDEDVIRCSGSPAEDEEEDDNLTMFFDVSEQEVHRIVWYENGKEQTKVLTSWPVVLGKQKGTDNLCINDPSVSRRHARLNCRNNSIFIEDLGSKNGTFMNGRKVKSGEEIPISADDRLQLGRVAFSIIS